MTTPTYTPADIVNFALAKDGVNLASAFDQLVGSRVVDAIQSKKQELASTTFNELPDTEDEQVDHDEQSGHETETDDQPEGDAGEAEQLERETEESDENTQSTD